MRGIKRKGQSVLEYTLLLAVIIGIIVAVLFGTGGVNTKIQATYDKSGSALEKTTADLNQGVFTGSESK